MTRRTKTTTVKKSMLFRVYGERVRFRTDPQYCEASGLTHKPAIEPEGLRYDLAFVHRSDPTLIAFVRLSSGYGMTGSWLGGTWGGWSDYRFLKLSDSHPWGVEVPRGGRVVDQDNEVWNSIELEELHYSLSLGRDWITYRHPVTTGGPRDYTFLVPVTLAEILVLHPSKHPNEAAPVALTSLPELREARLRCQAMGINVAFRGEGWHGMGKIVDVDTDGTAIVKCSVTGNLWEIVDNVKHARCQAVRA